LIDASARVRGVLTDEEVDTLFSHAASLDWSQCPAVESIPGKVSGAWVFKDTRMPVAAVFENLDDGVTIDELTELYAGLTREQITAVLDFAARSLDAPAHAG
jgi:uncharacterized protein (DUF433 family)